MCQGRGRRGARRSKLILTYICTEPKRTAGTVINVIYTKKSGRIGISVENEGRMFSGCMCSMKPEKCKAKLTIQ